MSTDVKLAGALAALRPDVRAANGYLVQASTGMIKLDAMENPYRLGPDLRQELGRRLADLPINRYPSAGVERLRGRLSEHVGAPEGWHLMLGNGSDELIALLLLACAQPGASVVAPEPSFVMYRQSAWHHGLRFVGVALRSDFELDLEAVLAALRGHSPALVFLAYPNNPTANLWSTDAMRAIIDAARGLVVIDEAYQPFSSRTWMDEIRRNPAGHGHVLVLRTLSKFGLAGARLGYLVGPAPLIAELDKLRPPYNVSTLNAECGCFALDHAAVFESQAASIRVQRARLEHDLARLPGTVVHPSEANMILLRVPDAAAVFAGLRERGILVKNMSRTHALLTNCLRITVGTEAENDGLMTALGELL